MTSRSTAYFGKWLSAVIVACVCAPAHGQVAALIIDKSRVPSGITVLETGINPRDQFVIPRYVTGTTHPGGSLIGWGPQSIIAATTGTVGKTNKAIVVTDGSDGVGGTLLPPPDSGEDGLFQREDISEWQHGSSGVSDAAVLQTTLANCTVMGIADGTEPFPDNYDWNDADTVVNDAPRSNDQGEPILYNGADLFGNGGMVYNVGFFGIPGTACTVDRRGSARFGWQEQHDRLRWKVERCYARRCYRGFWCKAVDMTIGDIEVEAVRDWGVRMDNSVQFGIIHVYGCGYATEPDGSGGAALWIRGTQCMGGPIYVENSQIGLNASGIYTSIHGITSFDCIDYNMLILGAASHFYGVDLRRCPKNIRIGGDGNGVHGGTITLAESGTGIEIMDGGSDGYNNDSTVRDIAINGYGDKNGNNNIDSGEEFADSAIGIDVNTQVRSINITGVHIDSCTKGIDFSGGTIYNDGSVIWVNTTNCTTPVTWPSGQTWDTTPDANETCDIRINGVRYYGPTSGSDPDRTP